MLVFASKMTEGERDMYGIFASNEAPCVTILYNVVLLKVCDYAAEAVLSRKERSWGRELCGSNTS